MRSETTDHEIEAFRGKGQRLSVGLGSRDIVEASACGEFSGFFKHFLGAVSRGHSPI
jgi:hypothetical protein